MGTIAIFTIVSRAGFDSHIPVAQVPRVLIAMGFVAAFFAAAAIAVIAAILPAIARDAPQ